MKKITAAAIALLALNLSAWAVTAEKTDDKAAKTDTYPLTTCVVSGEKLGEMGDAVIFNYEGREVRFCCKDCIKDFNKDPEAYLKQIDDAKKASTAKDADVELKHSGHDHGKMGH